MDITWDKIQGLLGVIIGSLLTFATTYLLEQSKSKRELKKEYRTKQREALEQVLNWVDPLERALAHHSYIAGTSLFYSDIKARPEAGSLFTELKRFDLSPAQRAVLTLPVYEMSYKIIELIESLQTIAEAGGKEEYFVLERKIRDEYILFRKQIMNAYNATFV